MTHVRLSLAVLRVRRKRVRWMRCWTGSSERRYGKGVRLQRSARAYLLR